MGFFKTKEEKLILLNKELEELKESHKHFLGNIMLIDQYIFVFKDFKIVDNEINFCYEDKNTPSEMYNLQPLWLWNARNGNNFKKYRKDWIYLRDSLDRLGVDVKIRE